MIKRALRSINLLRIFFSFFYFSNIFKKVQKIICIVFIAFFLNFPLFGQVIGIIEEVQGTVTISQEENNTNLEEYDDLILGQTIKIADQSKITLSLNDGTIFIFENESEFKLDSHPSEDRKQKQQVCNQTNLQAVASEQP